MLHTGRHQPVQQGHEVVLSPDGGGVKALAQGLLDHFLVVDDAAALDTEGEAVHLAVDLGHIALRLGDPGLVGQVRRLLLRQGNDVGGVQNGQRGGIARVVQADHLGVGGIAVGDGHDLHMDAGLLLVGRRHLHQSGLDLRLGVEQGDAGAAEGRVILKGVHRHIDGLHHFHRVGVVRVAGKAESASGQQSGHQSGRKTQRKESGRCVFLHCLSSCFLFSLTFWQKTYKNRLCNR